MDTKQNIAVTTDCAIFFGNKKELKILLVQRKNEPFKGEWALPGGFLEEQESMEAGAKRELEEETGLKIKKIQQIEAFGALGRDPRGRTISIAFWGEALSEEKVMGADDALTAQWFETTQLPNLAFDHKKIIELAIVKYYSKKE